jgi:asparaginyl-tRNA synthetase
MMNVKEILISGVPGEEITVKGWVKTKRESKHVAFIALNDGSTINNLQIVVNRDEHSSETLAQVVTGAALSVRGKLIESQGSGQKTELIAHHLEILGKADPEIYPLQAKKHSLEFLREIAHLRFRTNTFGAITRIRHTLTYAIHDYFHSNGFFNITTPVVTCSDCEGAGQMFRVTTLDLKNIPLTDEGAIDFSNDFFGKETKLTVSGQLEAETAALALSKVYTFGPTFRAENSNTSRHLAEFWMVEPEMAFCDLNDDMDLAEDFLKNIITNVIENCKEDLQFLSKRLQDEEKHKKAEERSSMELMDKLIFVVNNDFERITYTDAFQILRNSKFNKKKKFQFPVHEWGMDIQSEHERYLVEKHFKKPVIITDYPKDIKAFYMRMNDDKKTVRAMDVLFPGIGEIIGGSQREERYDMLRERIHELNILEKDIWWYLDTRRFGTCIHSGFGLGFERLVLFVTGMSNIRDVIPFPRTPRNAEF